jgi:hypothetical protein
MSIGAETITIGGMDAERAFGITTRPYSNMVVPGFNLWRNWNEH